MKTCAVAMDFDLERSLSYRHGMLDYQSTSESMVSLVLVLVNVMFMVLRKWNLLKEVSAQWLLFISGSWKTGAKNWAKQSLGDLPHGHSILLDEGGSPKLD